MPPSNPLPPLDALKRVKRHGTVAALLMGLGVTLIFGVPLAASATEAEPLLGASVEEWTPRFGQGLWIWGCCHLAVRFGIPWLWGLFGLTGMHFLLLPLLIFWASSQKATWQREAVVSLRRRGSGL